MSTNIIIPKLIYFLRKILLEFWKSYENRWWVM